MAMLVIEARLKCAYETRDARWLTTDERQALEKQIALEMAQRTRGRRMTLVEAFRNPKVLLLATAYFCSTTANYGIEFFLPSILSQWYSLSLDKLTWLIILPPCLALAGQLFVGWNSDRIRERRCHAAVCIAVGLAALACAPSPARRRDIRQPSAGAVRRRTGTESKTAFRPLGSTVRMSPLEPSRTSTGPWRGWRWRTAQPMSGRRGVGTVGFTPSVLAVPGHRPRRQEVGRRACQRHTGHVCSALQWPSLLSREQVNRLLQTEIKDGAVFRRDSACFR